MLAKFLIGATGGVVTDLNNIVLVYDTRLSSGTTISVPTGSGSHTIDWGDGTSNSYNTSGYKNHTYSVNDVYIVQVSGTVTSFGNSSAPTANNVNKLQECLSFGNVGLTSLSSAFRDCSNLTSVPSSIPSAVTALTSMFFGCTSFNDNSVTSWNTTNVTDMNNTFRDATSFNRAIGSWTMTNVASIRSMFEGATSFNQSLNSWNTINITDMSRAFQSATAFNNAIGGWNTSSVVDMGAMFALSTSFNQYIGDWDTSSVIDMVSMFNSATVFDQNLTGWCVTNITSEPSNFSVSSALSPGNKPVWGTCPP